MEPKHRRPLWALLSAASLVGAALHLTPAAQADPVPPRPAISGFDLSREVQQPSFTYQQLAVPGDGYNCHRIPAVGVAPNGDVLASWDGRPFNCGDSPQAIDIVQRVSHDNGVTFEERQVTAAGQRSNPKFGHADNSIIVDWETGRIFNMHVHSYDVSFQGSREGNDVNARNVLHVSVNYSDDNGATWSQDRIITPEIVPASGVAGRFATSGNGIQLRYGPHKGRLIQPAVVKTGGAYKAVMWYSDDHGASWQAGQPFGVGMDENKVVELSDGRLMDNSRISSGASGRYVSYSSDGGVTWTDPVANTTLIDPRNNASLIRAFPNAAEGTPEAKVLLFSNTRSSNGRKNPALRVSCDDGQTWTDGKVYTPTNTAYTHLTTLADGTIGILYESGMNGSLGMGFAKVNLDWLDQMCIGTSGNEITVNAGETVTANVTLNNVLGSNILDRQLQFNAPDGWTISAPAVTLSGQQEVVVPVEITAPAHATAGKLQVPFSVIDARAELIGSLQLTVNSSRTATVQDVSVSAAIRDPKPAYAVGDKVFYNFTYHNPSAESVAIVPTATPGLEGFDQANKCRWRNLGAGKSAVCGSAYHVVTEEDVQRGYFAVDANFLVTTPDGNVANVLKTLSVPTPPTVASNDPNAAAPQHLDLAIDPIADRNSTTSELEVPVRITVTPREDYASIPEGAKVAIYDGSERVAEFPVSEGVASGNITVDSVPVGKEAVTHHLTARLIHPATPGRTSLSADANASFVVNPLEQEQSQMHLNVSDISDIISDGSPRTVVLKARVQKGDQALAQLPVEFFLNDTSLGTVYTDASGLAERSVEVASVATDGSQVQYTFRASTPQIDEATVVYAAAEDSDIFVVHPQPAPEPIPTVTSTATVTTTFTPEPVTETLTTTVVPEPVTTTETATETTTVTDILTETEVQTSTETVVPEPVTLTETTTVVPEPVTQTETTTLVPEPVTTTLTTTKVPEPVTSTVTTTVRETVVETAAPTHLPAPAPVTVTKTAAPQPAGEGSSPFSILLALLAVLAAGVAAIAGLFGAGFRF